MKYKGPDKRYKGHEICIGSNETALSLQDVTDKAKPKFISRAAYPNVGYTHQGWLTEDAQVLLPGRRARRNGAATVEKTRTLIWDFTDLENPKLVKEHIGDDAASDHNQYVKGDLLYQSNYRAGLRVLSIKDPIEPEGDRVLRHGSVPPEHRRLQRRLERLSVLQERHDHHQQHRAGAVHREDGGQMTRTVRSRSSRAGRDLSLVGRLGFGGAVTAAGRIEAATALDRAAPTCSTSACRTTRRSRSSTCGRSTSCARSTARSSASRHRQAALHRRRAGRVALVRLADRRQRVVKIDRQDRIVGQFEMETPGMLALAPPDRLVDQPVDERRQSAEADRHHRPHDDEGRRAGRAVSAAASGGDARRRYAYTGSLGVNQIASIAFADDRVEVTNVAGPTHSLVQFAATRDGKTLVATAEMSGQLLVFDLAAAGAGRASSRRSTSARWRSIRRSRRTKVRLGAGEEHERARDPRRRRPGPRSARIKDDNLKQPQQIVFSPDGATAFVTNNNKMDHMADPAHAGPRHARLDGMAALVDRQRRRRAQVEKAIPLGKNLTGMGTRARDNVIATFIGRWRAARAVGLAGAASSAPVAACAGSRQPAFTRAIAPFPVLDEAGRPFALPFLGGLDVPRPQFVDIDADGDLDLFLQEYSQRDLVLREHRHSRGAEVRVADRSLPESRNRRVVPLRRSRCRRRPRPARREAVQQHPFYRNAGTARRPRSSRPAARSRTPTAS